MKHTVGPNMLRRVPVLLWMGILVAHLIAAVPAIAATPTVMNFQAFVTEDHDDNPETLEIPVEGERDIRFTIWSDPVSTDPGDAVWMEVQTLSVTGGQLHALLGAVEPLTVDVWAEPDRFLEYWDLSDEGPATPRLQFGTVPFASHVSTLDGASGGQIQGALSISQSLDVEGLGTFGSLRMPDGAMDGYVMTSDAGGNATWETPPTVGIPDSVVAPFVVTDPMGAPRIVLDASVIEDGPIPPTFSGDIDVFDETGAYSFKLRSDVDYGGARRQPVFRMYRDDTGNYAQVRIDASENGEQGPRLELRDITGREKRIILDAWTSAGAEIELKDGDEQTVIELQAQGVYGASIHLEHDNEQRAIEIRTMQTEPGGPVIRLFDDSNENQARIQINARDEGGEILLRDSSDPSNTTISLKGETGLARVHCLQITGGCDFAEHFDIGAEESKVAPGMVMVIDENSPGKLAVSRQPYDRKVAGIVSGAGGINPGMLMGQEESIADGEYPIALSGRVFCHADASNGPIRPGDLLVTSGNPGHAMRATDATRTQGAVVGKAMTSLDSGIGLVLVLVTLQ